VQNDLGLENRAFGASTERIEIKLNIKNKNAPGLEMGALITLSGSQT
jgi:hypothetical protein